MVELVTQLLSGGFAGHLGNSPAVRPTFLTLQSNDSADHGEGLWQPRELVPDCLAFWSAEQTVTIDRVVVVSRPLFLASRFCLGDLVHLAHGRRDSL